MDNRIETFRLSYVTLYTSNLEQMVEHYTKVMGLHSVEKDSDGTAYLSTSTDHHNLILKPSSTEKGLKNIGLQVKNTLSMEEIAKQLSEAGIQAAIKTDASPGLRQFIEFTDTEGNEIHLFTEMQSTGLGMNRNGIGPNKLGHIARWVENPKEMVHFYETILSFRVSDWMRDFFAFMRCNQDHHSVNFIKAIQPDQVNQLHHLAFELHDWGHLKDSLDLLGRHNTPIVWGPLRHGIGHNIAAYHQDPDGNLVELFIELDIMNEAMGYFEPRPWHRDFPQRPKVWEDTELATSLWGIKPPEGLVE
ncbi:VOC family protein [Peribacillus kribbensis]|uniref:VOC family protein n=1 Tax=Peribacillus kribbensis TaxID=356658 RepID=UPI0004027188|nr:VOC family protein [Peribacillus kribbensis]